MVAAVAAVASLAFAYFRQAVARPAADPGSLLPDVPESRRQLVTNERIENLEATVPPQCYTKTEGRSNPCYTCHQMYDRRARDRLNELDDGSLQGDYGFSEVGETNHHTNLFVDRSSWLEQIDDSTILAYVRSDNYDALAHRLRQRGFSGFVPDLGDYGAGASAFEADGLAKDGSHWVAFNYKPFPGTFWPTNGSADDVLIRLPKAFREVDGHFSREAYFVNLTLVELSLQERERASIAPVDEHLLGEDLDSDGRIDRAEVVTRRAHYVGDAKDVAIEFQQAPAGTEFLHSVRYLDVNEEGRVVAARRMKELRYMKKVSVLPRQVIRSRYANERKEKLLEELPSFLDKGDQGLDNALGWFLLGFVEDYRGELRPQSFEEAQFCMGCHTAIGTTIDSTFSLPRKVPGREGWRYVDLAGMKDAPNLGEKEGEILGYLRRAGGGSEFRENPEMKMRWFDERGRVLEEKVLSADVYELVTPSERRALDLDKAYSHIVRHQSFTHGRDATWKPAENVLSRIEANAVPLEESARYYGWDLRLGW